MKARYFLLFSLISFVIIFIVLNNGRFASNPTIESIGQIITLVMILSIMVNIILTVVNGIKKIGQNPQKTEDKKSPTEIKFVQRKNLFGRLLLLWLLIVFPIIGMTRMVTLSKLSEGGKGTLLGTILFTIMAVIGTIIPGLYLSPLILCIFPLFIFSFYFLFSKERHKLGDFIGFCIVLILLILQIWGFILLMRN
jgi:hypothetical protein